MAKIKKPGLDYFPLSTQFVNDRSVRRVLKAKGDGVERNYSGLLSNLARYRIPPGEQYALICKSDFGRIGHPIWKGLYVLNDCGGRIKVPGRYLLSLCT